MRALVQRVSHAKVSIANEIKGKISSGLLIFIGITHEDTYEDLEWVKNKIISLRIFSDKDLKMNLSVRDIKGSLLVISQFTLYANCKKGNRPSYTRSAPPTLAIPLYEKLLLELSNEIHVESGEFGADMKVELLNDGPVTILLDSKNKEI